MANTGPAKTKRAQREICVKEEFKIAVKIALDRFRFEEKQKGNPLDFLRIKMSPRTQLMTTSCSYHCYQIGIICREKV